MSTENNGNILNDAVEQVNTDETSVRPSEGTANQNNQQSTAANTVATGADLQAPQVSGDNQPSGDNSGESSEDSSEGGVEGNQGRSDNSPPQASQSANAQSAQLGSEQSSPASHDSNNLENSNNPNTNQNDEVQHIGGSEQPQQGFNNGRQSSESNNSQNSQSANSANENAANSRDQNNRDEITDEHSFDVNVAGPTASDELASSDAIVDEFSFDVDITAVNDAPVLTETTFTINEDNSITITPDDLLANVSDVDGDTVVVTDISAGDHGSVVKNQDGNWVFTPDENYAGDAILTISLSDGTATTEHNATVSITPDADVPSLTVSPAETVLIDSESAPSITTGWLTVNANNHIETHPDYVYTGVDEGRGNVIELEANRGDESNIYQDLNISAGDTVTLSFDLSARKNYEGEDSQVNVYFEGVLVDAIIPEQVGWNTFTYELTATTDNPRLEFNAPDNNGVGGVLDQISVIAGGIFAEDTAVSLDINPALTDTDGSEEIDSVVLDSIMVGATLTDGVNSFFASESNDSVDVKDWDLSALTFQGPQDFVGDVTLDVTVTAVETANGASAQTTETIEFSVFNVNDPVVIDENSKPEFNSDEDSVIHITEAALLANASDVDGDDLTVTNLSIDNATFTTVIDPDTGARTFIVTPDENVNGDLSINFNVTDSQGSTVVSGADLVVAAVNDGPSAVNQTFNVNEDGTLTITDTQLLNGAADIEGDSLSIMNVSYTGNDGVMSDNGNSTYTFIPNVNFNGEITSEDLSFTVSDGTNITVASMTITVNNVNDAPVVGTTFNSVNEDTTITITQDQLLINATDVDGDSLSASNLSAENATIVDNGDGTFSMTPEQDFHGHIDVSYDVSDGSTLVTSNLNLTVDPVNDLPTTTGDTVAIIDEDTSITVNQAQLLANAADIDGDTLTASNLSAENATVVDNSDGTFSITPDQDFNGHIDVAYDISDGSTLLASNLGLTVDPINDAPIISADVSITIDEDGSYRVSQAELLQFASDIEGHSMVADIGEQGVETSAVGIVVDASTGLGIDGAVVTLADEAGNSIATTTDIGGYYSILGNIVGDGSVTIEQEGAITNSFNINAGSSVDSGTTALSTVMDGDQMRVVLTWGDNPRDLDNHLWLFDTETGAELDHIYYADMNHDLGNGTVTQDVDDVNGNGPETITIPSFAEADMHYSVHNYSNNSWQVDGIDEASVEVYVGDTLVQTFTPNIPADMDGSHWHVFDIVDGTIVPTQSAAAGNDFTLPSSDAVAANPEGINIVDAVAGVDDETDIDTSNEALNSQDAITAEESGASVDNINIPNGDIIDNGDGTYTIVPDENFNGDFSISYDVVDTLGASSPALLNVNVTAINDNTVLVDHDYSLNEDGTITITDDQLLLGSSDIDTGDVLSVVGVSYSGADGVLTDNDNGTHTFLPNEHFNGTVNLNYSVSDGTDTTIANININVAAVNDAPVVSGELEYSMNEDGTLTFSQAQLLARASDVDELDYLSANNLTASGNSSVVNNGDGTFTVIPDANFSGEIELSFDITDSSGEQIESGVNLTVNSINDAPIAPAITTSGIEDQSITIDPAYILANASDIDSDELTLESLVIRQPLNATLSQNQDGTYQVVVPDNFNGIVDLSYTVSDGDLTTAGSLNLNIMAVDDAPFQTGNAHLAVVEDGSVTFYGEDLIDLFSDVDSALTISRVITADGGEAEGSLLDNGDGSWTFTPTDDFAGTTGLVIVATDGTSEATLDMNVYVRPIADGVAISTDFEGPLVFAEDSSGFYSLNIDQLDTSEVITSVMMTGYPVGFIVGDGLNSVEITEEGQAVDISNWDMDSMSITPPSDFNGSFSVTVSVVSLDEVESPSLYDVTEELGSVQHEDSGFVVDEDGSVLITAAELLGTLEDADALEVSTVSYGGDEGTLIDNNNGTWTFWASPDYIGDVDIAFSTSDGQEHIQLVTVPADDGPELLANSVEPSIVENNSDYNVAPGDSVNIFIDEDIANNQDVDSVLISGLPDGIEPQNGVELDSGDFVISGELSQPITLDVADGFSGEVTMTLSGIDSQDQPVDDATQEIVIDVDEANAMQGSSTNNANPLTVEHADGNADWTTADNSQFVVDPMDDSVAIEHNNEPSIDDDVSTGMDL